MRNEHLRSYLKTLTTYHKKLVAERCGTTFQHMRNIGYGDKTCAPELAINIERESLGAVTCEVLCPNVDWTYIRGTKKIK